MKEIDNSVFRGKPGDIFRFHDAAGVSPEKMIGAVIFVFIISVLGAAFTSTLQTQVDAWKANLTTAGQSGAATVVGLIPLLFWILLGVGIILALVAAFLPGKLGL